jgi:hypothetical protein
MESAMARPEINSAWQNTENKLCVGVRDVTDDSVVVFWFDDMNGILERAYSHEEFNEQFELAV